MCDGITILMISPQQLQEMIPIHLMTLKVHFKKNVGKYLHIKVLAYLLQLALTSYCLKFPSNVEFHTVSLPHVARMCAEGLSYHW